MYRFFCLQSHYRKGLVFSWENLDNAKAAYDNAKAALRAAKINLDYCQVVAPVSGYSSKESFTPGNLVSNNSLLTYVDQTDPMYIDFSIAAPQHMRRQQLAAEGRLRFPEGNIYKARLRLLDGSMYQGEGQVDFIDSRVQPETGVVQARASFANSDGRIMPGQYVRIFMDGDVLVNAVLIPQKTIGDMYLVDSGLKGGERIICEGMVKARPGAKVSVMGDGQAQKGQAAQKTAQK